MKISSFFSVSSCSSFFTGAARICDVRMSHVTWIYHGWCEEKAIFFNSFIYFYSFGSFHLLQSFRWFRFGHFARFGGFVSVVSVVLLVSVVSFRPFCLVVLGFSTCPSGLWNNFGKYLEIFGKWSEIFGKSSKTQSSVC